MNKVARIALYASPFVAVGAGLIAAQLLARGEHEPSGERCENPSMRVTLEDGAFVVTPADKQGALLCRESGFCSVNGPEQVELTRGDEVRCLDVPEHGGASFAPRENGQTLYIVEDGNS